jgi:hypothetical protein
MEASVSDALEHIPEEARAVIVTELTRRDAALLADLRGTRELSLEQRSAVERVLAAAVVASMGADWTPNEHGLAVERAIDALMKTWPIGGD